MNHSSERSDFAYAPANSQVDESVCQSCPVNLSHSADMASVERVRQYLAYWFQLGQGVVIRNGAKVLLPKRVISGNSYSPEFETCWQYLTSPQAGDCYLQGTNQTIAELLSPAWDISPCARCSMPVPLRQPGFSTQFECPCADLPSWPNSEMPMPRAPIDSQNHLSGLRDRLGQCSVDEDSPLAETADSTLEAQD